MVSNDYTGTQTSYVTFKISYTSSSGTSTAGHSNSRSYYDYARDQREAARHALVQRLASRREINRRRSISVIELLKRLLKNRANPDSATANPPRPRCRDPPHIDAVRR